MTLELDLQGMVGLQMPHQINTFDFDVGVTDDAATCMLCSMQVVTTMSVIAAAVALRALRSARLYAMQGAVHRHVLTFATSGRL